MNHVAIHDILESDFNAPLTDEVLKKLGFKEYGDGTYKRWAKHITKGITLETWEERSEPDKGWNVYLLVCMKVDLSTTWTTVGGVKLLIEALKGDEMYSIKFRALWRSK